MSLYIGKDLEGLPTIHATRSQYNVNEMNNSRKPDSILHRDIPILVGERDIISLEKKTISTSDGVYTGIYFDNTNYLNRMIFTDSAGQVLRPATYVTVDGDCFSYYCSVYYQTLLGGWLSLSSAELKNVPISGGTLFIIPAFLFKGDLDVFGYILNIDHDHLVTPTEYNANAPSLEINKNSFVYKGVDFLKLRYINFGSVNQVDPVTNFLDGTELQLINFNTSSTFGVYCDGVNGFSAKSGDRDIINSDTKVVSDVYRIYFELYGQGLTPLYYKNGVNVSSISISESTAVMLGATIGFSGGDDYCSGGTCRRISSNGGAIRLQAPITLKEGNEYHVPSSVSTLVGTKNAACFKFSVQGGILTASVYSSPYANLPSVNPWNSGGITLDLLTFS